MDLVSVGPAGCAGDKCADSWMGQFPLVCPVSNLARHTTGISKQLLTLAAFECGGGLLGSREGGDSSGSLLRGRCPPARHAYPAGGAGRQPSELCLEAELAQGTGFWVPLFYGQLFTHADFRFWRQCLRHDLSQGRSH